jgi:hypothetical protein
VDIAVHHAEQLPDGYVRLIVEAVTDDGESHLGYHFMPADSVEWRVAQFNITAEQALDMVVTEPFLREDKSVEHDLQPTRSKARTMAKKAVEDAATVTYVEGPLPGEMTASPNAVAESGEDDPKAFLLDVLPVDDTAISAKRRLMDANRAVTQALNLDEVPVDRRNPPTMPTVDSSHYVTAIEESPSELAQRLIASRLEQVRTRRNVPS